MRGSLTAPLCVTSKRLLNARLKLRQGFKDLGLATGRLGEARQEVRSGLAVDPRFTLQRFRAVTLSDNAVFLAQRERVAEGMRMAGVPEE